MIAAKLWTFALAALAGQTLAQQATRCNADNCLRQVRASAFPSRSTRQDCSAFQASQTATVTATSTVTATVTTGLSNPKMIKTGKKARRHWDLSPPAQKREVAAPAIPTYASSCNPVRYASACSCIGITASFTTTATTVTVSKTATVGPQPTFSLVVNYPDNVPAPLDSQAIYINDDLARNLQVLYAIRNGLAANPFSFDTDGSIYLAAPAVIAPDYVATFPDVRAQNLELFPKGQLADAPAGAATLTFCSITAGTRELVCDYQGSPGIFAICSDPQYVNTLIRAKTFADVVATFPNDVCVPVTLTAVPTALRS